MRFRLVAAAAVTLCIALPVLAQPIITGGAAVSLVGGPFGVARAGSPWGAPALASPGSLVDGVPQPELQQWNLNSIWWDRGGPTAPSSFFDVFVEIDLGNVFSISRVGIQADNNDRYGVYYRSSLLDPWQGLGFFFETGGPGLVTRGPFGVAPFSARYLALGAFDGDGYYSISEFGAYGEVVPEPASVALLATGLIGVGAVARRRRRLR